MARDRIRRRPPWTAVIAALRGIEGIDGTTSTRDALIEKRNTSLSAGDMGMAVLLSHAIAHLARLERVESLFK